MKATAATIAKLIDQPSPERRFYLFWGPDEGQSRALAMRLLQSLGADRFMIISNRVKGDPASLADEAGALSLFGGRRVIWIEPAGDEIKDGILALLDAAVVESPVLAIAPGSGKPRELIRIAETSSAALCYASYAPEGLNAERMVVEVGRRLGLTIGAPVAARVAGACNNDEAIVTRELEKLALYLDASTNRPMELDHDAIDAVGADLQDGASLRLSDWALSGDVKSVAVGLGETESGGDAVTIVRAVQRRLLQLAPARARMESGQSVDDVMAAMGKALFWKEKALFRAMLERWSAGDLARLSERLGATERTLLFSDAPPLHALGEELMAIGRAARRR